jgi:amidase
MAGFPEFDRFDGLGMAELVRGGQVNPLDLVEEAVRRIETRNPVLNAVIHPMFESARRATAGPLPKGPFAGVPFVVKDLIALVAGEPQRNGCRFFDGWVPDHDSEIVKRYRAAGFVFVGKTNTPEFGLTPFTEPRFTGITRNPWNPDRTAGGSSGGTGSAVAAGMVPLGHGNDGGGSIRIPASANGLFGLKPSRGRTPLGPDYGEFWQGFACDHVLTRSVRDSAAALDATAGADPGAPYVAPPPARPFLEEVTTEPGRLRIGFTARPWLGQAVHDDCVAALERTVGLLRHLGHEVVEAEAPIDGVRFAQAFMMMICGEVATDLAMSAQLTGRPLRRDAFEVETWGLALMGRTLSAGEFAGAVRYLKSEARRLAAWQEQFDLLLTPTLSCPPPPHGTFRLPRKDLLALQVLGAIGAGGVLKASGMIAQAASEAFSFIPWTPVSNATGQPAMSVPLEWNREGLPVGMHFIASYGDEATLFRLAGQLERAQPWFDRRPGGIGRDMAG